MSFITEKIDDEYIASIPPTTTAYSKTFIFHGWNQKMLLILSDQQVVVSIEYAWQWESAPAPTDFFVLTTAKNVTLPANEIIPYGVEDPVHFARVKIVTQVNTANVRVVSFGSR